MVPIYKRIWKKRCSSQKTSIRSIDPYWSPSQYQRGHLGDLLRCYFQKISESRLLWKIIGRQRRQEIIVYRRNWKGFESKSSRVCSLPDWRRYSFFEKSSLCKYSTFFPWLPYPYDEFQEYSCTNLLHFERSRPILIMILSLDTVKQWTWLSAHF